VQKHIFTESQYNKLVKTILKEDEEVSGGVECYPAGYAAQKSLMKNCEISDICWGQNNVMFGSQHT